METKSLKIKAGALILTGGLVLAGTLGCGNTVSYDTEKPVTTERQETEMTAEEKTISYLSDSVSSIKEKMSSINKEDVKETVDNEMVEIVGFLAYNEPYKDTLTFAELSDKGKETVIGLWQSLDQFIVEYYPDYKIDAKTGWAATKNMASDLWNTGQDNVDKKLEEQLGTEKWDTIKGHLTDTGQMVQEDFNDVKDTVKEGGEAAGGYIKEKVDGWYQTHKK